MDIYCPRCGEPWDTDEFHYLAEELGTTFNDTMTQFARKGCEVIPEQSHNPYAQLDHRRALVAAVAFEIMGDDVDGIVAMMDDAEALGLWEV
jgi:hypothetical protein